MYQTGTGAKLWVPWLEHNLLTVNDNSNNYWFVLLFTAEKSGDWSLSSLSLCSQQSRRRMCARLSPSCWKLTSIRHHQATRCLMTYVSKCWRLCLINMHISTFGYLIKESNSLVCEGRPLLLLFLRKSWSSFVVQYCPRVAKSVGRFLWKCSFSCVCRFLLCKESCNTCVYSMTSHRLVEYFSKQLDW